jgi:hypothetical protein
MSASYTQLKDGSWGLRVKSSVLVEGQTIVVSKKDGSSKNETVGKILWTGKDKFTGDNVALTTISKPVAVKSNGGGFKKGRSRSNWSGCSCGSLEDEPRASDCASCQHDY